MSELANWNGHLDPIPQRALRQPTSSPNASNLSLESYHPPVDHQEYDVIEQPSLLDEFLEDKRTEESVVVHGEREPSINLFPDVQLHDLVDTSSVSSDNVYSPYDQPSVPRTPENSGMQLLQLSAYSKPALFHLPHNSSVNIFRVQEVGASPSSREDSALSETADFMCRNEPEIIDLTGNEDNEDEELTVDEMLTDVDVYVSDDHLESRSSHQRSPAPRSPPRSSPIGQHESLFTPPPISKRRRRMMMAHIAVPSFPKGFSKADYQPMSEAFLAPFHEAPITRGVEHLSIADALGAAFNQNRASPSPPVSLEKHKGKESELLFWTRTIHTLYYS
ncbi:hypothetical protein HYDPIDRAFT_28949 [Hydnomerulius pinastri MD-312]|uniref:Uncharacterized protein n=1 Tax=Hydnomerulius pinastri MD-312 TaxID=994086 RepID=A0A0C9W8W3_9AGAM|nr:hypothetical protein HYDPIDRAFT_28949 [Hydnomerulius pinastri MD-312]